MEEGDDGSLELELSPVTSGLAAPGALGGRTPGMVPLTVEVTEIVGVAGDSVGVVPEAVVAVVTGASLDIVVAAVVVVVVVVVVVTGTGSTSTLPHCASKEYQCVQCSKS